MGRVQEYCCVTELSLGFLIGPPKVFAIFPFAQEGGYPQQLVATLQSHD